MRRRSVAGDMASSAKRRAVGNGVQRPLGAQDQREEEEEDEVEEEDEDEEDSDDEEDEDDEIVDEVRHTWPCFCCRSERGKKTTQNNKPKRSGIRSCGQVVRAVGSCDCLSLWFRSMADLTQVPTGGF